LYLLPIKEDLAKGTSETNKKTGTSTENIKISTASIVETKKKKVHPESNKLKFASS
jgi:hypothetical protein